MTTPVAHVPATAPTYRRILPYLVAAAAVAAAVTLFLSLLGRPDVAASGDLDNARDWTRAETIDHLSRVNGVAGAAAASGSATEGMTRAEALERLYHINGVAPEEPTVPGGVR